MEKFSSLSPAELTRAQGFDCACGQRHCMPVKYLRIGCGAIAGVPDAVRAIGGAR